MNTPNATCLNDLPLDKLTEALTEFELKKYRAEQIFRWTANGAASFDEMTNLPNDLKEKLALHFFFKSVRIKEKYQSKLDSTRKFLMEMDDGALVESVLMEYKHGFSVCVSTQVGCQMGCKFCASTENGKQRDLSAAEILGQIIAIERSEDVKISNIVLMGMGEPLDNYDATLDFLRIVNSHFGLNIGIRHISVSTCGLVDKIDQLAKEGIGIALSISLHATTDEVRDSLMPINRKWNIEQVITACRNYSTKTGRRISFEYILIDGLNDTKEDSVRLANLLRGITEHVNLIPVNDARGGFRASPNSRVVEFRDWLMKQGVNTTIRRTLGSDISASCGQLRGRLEHEHSCET